MRFSPLVAVLSGAAGLASATGYSGPSPKHDGGADKPRKLHLRDTQMHQQQNPSQYLTNATAKYVVNGTAIPEVDFDIGESYAGLMPISSNKNESRQLYFWFFPSDNPEAQEEILIWLGGGPSCSALEGLLQDNGPFIWRPGTYKPIRNMFSWTNLTNVVYVEQPVGTGFSQGIPNATNATMLAEQFLGFWKSFVQTFAMQGRRVYIAGESYAGFYIPHIADAMFNKEDKEYFNLDSTMLYDPMTASGQTHHQIPALRFVEYWKGLHPFTEKEWDYLRNVDDSCGYTAYMDKYLTFPPPGPFPVEIPGAGEDGLVEDDCNIFNAVRTGMFGQNPFWETIKITSSFPPLWDVLGNQRVDPSVPEGHTIYFARPDVQAAINAPIGDWEVCADSDEEQWDDNSSLDVLPSVIERSNRTMIVQGALDLLYSTNGSLLVIQNLTWDGAQGFTEKPSDPFRVPLFNAESWDYLAPFGIVGTTHTERGLTWVSVNSAGLRIAQHAPSAAYRQVEFLIGRQNSLSADTRFSTWSY
ncbi:hypothetical protein JHW43_007865 [Diplocarpon mali]|nr:hypothetical protein JHW43_007865 [Diplocarpon mali]